MTSQALPVTSLRRPLPLRPALSLLLPAAAVVPVAAANGGYFPTAFGWTGLAFAWVVLVAAVATAPRLRLLDAVWALAALAYCGLTFLSALWAGGAGLAVDAGLRALVYATAVAGALIVLRRGELELWTAGLVLGAACVSFYALATRLLPDHFGAFNPGAGYRLYTPVGYWNGLGVFAAVAALLALGLAILGRGLLVRVAAGTALVVLLPTLYYTYSRGSWAALAVGLAAALACSPLRARLAAGLLLLVPLPAFAVWLASRPLALTNRATPLADASHAGHRLALELAVLAVGQAAAAFAWVVAVERLQVPARVRRAGLALLVAGAVAAAALLFVRVGSPSALATRAYDSFTGPPVTSGDLNSRLFSLSANGRIALWRSAWHEYQAHPLAGGGAGSFQRTWYRERTSTLSVIDAHNLYAQTLGELGLAGALLLAVFLGAPLAAAWRARPHPLTAGAVGAYAAFLVHNVVDWDWQLPAVTLLGLFAGATLVVAARGERETAVAPLRRRGRVVVAAVALSAAAAAFVGLIGNIALARAQTAIRSDSAPRALAEARTAYRWAPWSTEALRTRGEAELISGRTAAGAADLRRVTARDPGDWQAWFDLTAVTSGAERARAAARVRALDPRGPEAQLLARPAP